MRRWSLIRGKSLDENAAASVRAYATDHRGRVDVLASVLEGIAEHGYPETESGVLWEGTCDARLLRDQVDDAGAVRVISCVTPLPPPLGERVRVQPVNGAIRDDPTP